MLTRDSVCPSSARSSASRTPADAPWPAPSAMAMSLCRGGVVTVHATHGPSSGLTGLHPVSLNAPEFAFFR